MFVYNGALNNAIRTAPIKMRLKAFLYTFSPAAVIEKHAYISILINIAATNTAVPNFLKLKEEICVLDGFLFRMRNSKKTIAKSIAIQKGTVQSPR